MSSRIQSSVGVRHYVQVLWRRKWLVLEVVVVVPAVVLAVSLTRPTLYTGTARMMAVSQSPSVDVAAGTSVDASTPDERELETLASFVVTPQIARRVRRQLSWSDAPATLMAQTTAEVDPDANIILVSSERESPVEAARLANAFAHQYVDWRKKSQRQSYDAAIASVDAQIAATAPGSDERAALLERRSQLKVLRALAAGGLTLGESARPPAEPSSPKPLRDGVLALGAAIILGVGLAFLRDALDVRLHSADDIAEFTDLPVLATIPSLRRGERISEGLVVLDAPRGRMAEAFRFLRSSLDFLNFDHETTVVLVTSPLPAQGKSTTIANLAVTLATAGKKVSVVEGDLRRPALHRFFQISNARGLTTVVAGSAPLSEATQKLAFKDLGRTGNTPNTSHEGGGADTASTRRDRGLLVLPSGPLPPNPGEIVSSQQFANIIDALKSMSDYVLVDAPPMFAVGDATAMAGRVDGIIVILRLAETTSRTIANVEDFLSRVPARALGVVVTGVSESAGSSSRYGEYYD